MPATRPASSFTAQASSTASSTRRKSHMPCATISRSRRSRSCKSSREGRPLAKSEQPHKSIRRAWARRVRLSSMRPFEGRGRRGLLDLEVLRGCLSAVLDELELNGLTLVQRAKTRALDGGNVNEHVLSTLLRLNEAIALRRVEPLNCALRHASSPELQ